MSQYVLLFLNTYIVHLVPIERLYQLHKHGKMCNLKNQITSSKQEVYIIYKTGIHWGNMTKKGLTNASMQ